MKRETKRSLAINLASLLLLAGCGKEPLPSVPPNVSSSTVDVVRHGSGGTTRFLAKNVFYRLDPYVGMMLTEMNADVVLKDPTLPFIPANKTQYSLQIHHAVVEKDAASLAATMNNFVFNDADSPMRKLSFDFAPGKIIMKGEMKQLGLWQGFYMEGVLDVTPEGLIKTTPTLIKANGIRVDGLMNLLGLEMSKLMKTKEQKGVALRGNNIIMDPSRLYPPPVLHGRVTLVSIKNNKLHLEFDDGRAQPWPDLYVKNAPACLCMWGGDVLINSALSTNAKMQIIDSTPSTPMVFALDRYREQLEAGFVVPTQDGGMIAYVPDILNFNPNMGRFAPPSFPIPGITLPAPDSAMQTP